MWPSAWRFFYLPILVTMIFSFNSSKSLTKFTGFSMRWYTELLHNTEVSKAVYVSVTIAILATVISTVLGTITAIGLSKSRKVLKETLLNINNLPILNPDIVTAIGLMLHFFLTGLSQGIYHHAAGAYFLLYAICYHQCLSKGKKSGSQSGKCGNGSWSNTLPGIDKGNCAYDQGRYFRRRPACVYHVL